jgi:hypothetical protein
MYLSVSVFPTDYAMQGKQWATVTVNGDVVNAYCTPDQSCGNDWYSCVTNLEVSALVLPRNGGTLDVVVSSFGVLNSDCDINGHPLYVMVSLSEKLSNAADEISVFFFLYATAGFFMVMLLALLIHVCIKKEQNCISTTLKDMDQRRRAWKYANGGIDLTTTEIVVSKLLELLTSIRLKIISWFCLPKVSPNLDSSILDKDIMERDISEDSARDLEIAESGESGEQTNSHWHVAKRVVDGTRRSPRHGTGVQDKSQLKPFVLADMDLLMLRSRSVAKVHPTDNAEDTQLAKDEDEEGGFMEALQSWDHMDESHERKLQEDGKVNIMSQYRQLGRVSTMSWLQNNDIDA